MHVVVTGGDGPAAVSLEDAEDCGRLSVRLSGDFEASALDHALHGAHVGRYDGEHAWLAVAALRRLAAGQVPREWATAFDGMVRYAASKGWTDADGSHLRAHVERT